MAKLRNPNHERFCRAIVLDGEEARQAYVTAGYEANRANHNKLLNRRDVSARIEELTRERDLAARAARQPMADVLSEFASHGIDRLTDLFETVDGAIAIRDLRGLRPETLLAFLGALHDGAGIAWERSTAT
ncbi:terminase small subunit [Bradyrhizobium sp. BR13661]|jgi:hypothetical protein|uniref:terminase small subunit n=1 Tax=Bradyrhizobium sp. BR13661 TaxID=2940622 RepID=UPI002476D78C|nr:terminase small subunit [Bradyrhizobium sp. BR13661]MDH6259043.1 hypothetical protein [Bradyrhizobium sp. BR13661]